MTTRPVSAQSDAATVDLGHLETWIFDLDNTLYPMRQEIFSQVDVNIRDYVAALLNVPVDEARRIQKGYLASHGTTLCGLMDHHQVDADHFLDAVHDIDLSALQPDPALHEALSALDGRRLVFTNADQEHSERVLSRLGIESLIDDIFDIRSADWRPKPHSETYERFVARYTLDPLTSIMFEDMARNLIPAAELGMTTVWLDTRMRVLADDDGFGTHIDYRIDDLSGWLRAATSNRKAAEG